MYHAECRQLGDAALKAFKARKTKEAAVLVEQKARELVSCYLCVNIHVFIALKPYNCTGIGVKTSGGLKRIWRLFRNVGDKKLLASAGHRKSILSSLHT